MRARREYSADFVRSGFSTGFTLIEMSIVLVIIGLIVGSILVGQDLIRAAGVRATIAQIEKYNQVVNTFKTKYDNQIPGDISNPDAIMFGFAPRGTSAGEGDGNGVLDGTCGIDYWDATGFCQGSGETAMFWVDLSTAGLIEGGFNTASSSVGPPSGITETSLNLYFPEARLGGGNHVFVMSGGTGANTWSGTPDVSTGNPPLSGGVNYFGILPMPGGVSSGGYINSIQGGLTVSQAYSIDQKIDDGMPETGNVSTNYDSWNSGAWGAPAAVTGSSTTCIDNRGVSGINPASYQYSIEINGGAGVNCGLVFRFQ